MKQYIADFKKSDWAGRAALFLLSQNISLFGSAVAGYSVVWHLALETSSGFWMMMATICANVPQVLVSLIGGVWADRHERRRLIMLADGFIAVSTLLLAVVLWSGLYSMHSC